MQINWLQYVFDPHEGYGRHGMALIDQLQKMGVMVQPSTMCMYNEISGFPAWLKEQMPLLPHHLTIAMMIASDFPDLPSGKRMWGLTMYEADRVPTYWVERINATCERLIVPCKHNQGIFAQSGVNVPIHVVQEGIDPDEFPLAPYRPPAGGKYTFVTLGDRGSRKGVYTAWQAFYKAFPIEEYPDVRMLVKTRSGGLDNIDVSDFDGRILIWREDVGTMANVYRAGDCFVYPSYAEGWGLPPREAAAMGVPVIVPRHTGLEVGIDYWATRIIERYEMQPARLEIDDGGMWYVPDADEVAEHMKWCYHNREEAAQTAQNAGMWLHKNQTWAHAGQQLRELVEKYG